MRWFASSLVLMMVGLPHVLAAAQPQAAQAAQAAQVYHVVEVEDSDNTSAEALVNLLTEKLGAEKDKIQVLIDKLEKKGKAVMVAGSEEACKDAAQMFIDIGMKAEVRPLSASDLPSVYDDSDVIVAGAEKLQELLQGGKGVLVAFHAPWCGHCKTMVPAFKEAATTLKESGISVAAIDGQANAGLAQQLGVRAYPTIYWLQLTEQAGEEKPALGLAAYNGPRETAAFVEFAKAAHTQAGLKSKLPKGEAEATAEDATAEAKPAEPKAASKLGASKLGGSKIGASKLAEGSAPTGVQKAKMPAEAAAAPTEPAQETEPKPVAAAA